MSSSLSLPPETWLNVAQNFRNQKSPGELTYLWTSVRATSCLFRQQIERMFAEEHLPKTALHLGFNNSILSIRKDAVHYCRDHNTIHDERLTVDDHSDCALTEIRTMSLQFKGFTDGQTLGESNLWH